jgi:D-aspartate ligase
LGDGITALTAARCLGRMSIPVYLLGPDKNDIAYHSRYVKVIEQSNGTAPQDFVNDIREISESFESKPVIICAADKYLQVLSSEREQLQEFCEFVLPSSVAVDTVLDKGLFGGFCAANDMPAPKSWAPETIQQFDELLERATFPVLIKPSISHHAHEQDFQRDGAFAKMILAENEMELRKYFLELKRHGANLLIQEYIVGPDCEHYSYCSYRNSESRELVGVGFRKIRLNPIHGGAGTFIETSDSKELAEKSRTLLDKLNYTGISSICFKRHELTGNLMLHEVNGRLPMGHAVSLLSNINLPYVAYQDALGQQTELRRKNPSTLKWLALNKDLESFRKYRKTGELSTVQWLWSMRNVRVCAEFGWDDLRPFVFFLKGLVRRATKWLFGRSTNISVTR